MPRNRENPLPTPLIAALLEDGRDRAEKVALIADHRARHPESMPRLDAFLLEQVAGMRGALRVAAHNQERMESAMARLVEPPLVAAYYLDRGPERPRPDNDEDDDEDGDAPVPTALVSQANAQRVVAIAGEVDHETLRRGDVVLLNQDLSVLVSAYPAGPALGETAVVQRTLADGRLVVRVHDEQLVVRPTDALAADPPRDGDRVRWDRAARIAFERLPRESEDAFTPEAIRDIPLSAVGGQEDNLAQLVDALTLSVSRPDVAAAFGIHALPTVLLIGAPGCGKTLMVRAAAAELQRRTGAKGRICIVKPGEFQNEFVGVTERRIRECFASMRRAEGFGILFLDEIESIGRHRGGLVGHHSDKFLAALLAELQGFEDDADRRFAVIACTNRLDLMDPALVERMELQLFVRRPDMRAARRIFEIHLEDGVPRADGVARRTIVEHALSLLYGPNADNGVCTIHFGDGGRREVTTRDLVSGRCIEQICNRVRRAAARRRIDDPAAGIAVADVEDAVAELREKLAATLTRRNVHGYLDDLPQDQEVTRVESVGRVPRLHRALVA